MSPRFLTVLLLAAWLGHGKGVCGADWMNGVVTNVEDGDTIAIDTRGAIAHIRLEGIDCPEGDQPFAKDATAFVIQHARSKLAAVRLKGEETAGRAVGEVFLDGQSLNRELVRAGLAWWYERYSPNDHDLLRLQDDARRHKRGLWTDENVVPPWEWEQSHVRKIADAAPRIAKEARTVRRTADSDITNAELPGDTLAIPAGMLGVVSWNIQVGGTSPSASSDRRPMVERALHRMFSGTFQLLAGQEIPNHTSSEVLLGLLPATKMWRSAFRDTADSMDNGFWFDGASVVLNEHRVLLTTGEEDTDGRLVRDEELALHPPQWAHFAIGDFDFVLVTLHLTFHNKDVTESARELESVLDELDNYFGTPNADPDVIICGDFNIPTAASGEEGPDGISVDSVIRKHGSFSSGPRRLHVTVDEKTSRKSKRNGGAPANNYDHFIISEDCREEFLGARV